MRSKKNMRTKRNKITKKNKQKKKHKKKIKSGGIVSSMVSIDDLLSKSSIISPFLTNDKKNINENYIDTFIERRVNNMINNLDQSDNSPLSIKIQSIINKQLELAVKSEENNKIINDFMKSKLNEMSTNLNSS
tara:strand:+ start:232 stop:630 length:399 start_codon:yes stop_codon:yes gene_type:complete